MADDKMIKYLTRLVCNERGIEVTPDQMRLKVEDILKRIKNLGTRCGIDISKVDDLKLLMFVCKIMKEDF